MKSDTTRSTFKPEKHYSSVRLQQGRVQTDADWNEQADIQNHSLRTLGKSVIGPTGVPRDSDGFALSVEVNNYTHKSDIQIKSGRIFVDGILCQNEETIAFADQGDYPDATLPVSNGVYALYLETWERNITALEDSRLREVALGGPDTSTRARVISQVKYLSSTQLTALKNEKNLSLIRDQFQEIMTRKTGRLKARALPETVTGDPCEAGARGGYSGLENLLYRVEIHKSGSITNATFKWSRLNGSLVSEWISQSGESLTIADAGKDEVRRFMPGKWVELLDEHRVLRGEPGTMARILEVRGDSLIIDTTNLSSADYDIENFAGGKRFIRQWDMDDTTGPRRLQDMSNSANWLDLESDIELKFYAQSGETFRSGDYWLIPARVATRNIEWPCEDGGQPVALTPHGIDRSYCLLGLLTISSGNWSIRDMRAKFDGLLYQRPVPPQSTSVSPDIVHMVDEVEVTTNEPRYDLLEGVDTVQDMLDHLFTEKVNRSGDTITGNLRINQHLEVKGDLIVQGDTISRSNISQPGDVFLGDNDGDEVIIHGMIRAASAQTNPSVHITDSVHIKENLLVDGTMVPSSPESTYLAHFKGAGDFSVDASSITDGRFVIKSDGDVGIGTPTPTKRLDVQGGDVIISDNLYWNNGSSHLSTEENGAIILGKVLVDGARPYIEYNFKRGNTPHKVTLTAGAGNNLSVLDGSLGVGTEDPDTLLHVAGDTKIDGSLGIGTDATAKLHVDGDVKINGQNPLELGADVAGKDPMAGKIGYQLTTPTALDIYGAGTNATDTRRIKFWNEGEAMFTGPLRIGDATKPVNLDVSGDMNVVGNGTFGLPSATTSLTVNGTLSVSGNSNIGASEAPANLDVFGHATIGETLAPTSLNVIGTLSVTGDSRIGATGAHADLDVFGHTNIGEIPSPTSLNVIGTLSVTGDSRIGATGAHADLDVFGHTVIGETISPTSLNVIGTLSVTGDSRIGATGAHADLDVYGHTTIGEIPSPTSLNVIGTLSTTGHTEIGAEANPATLYVSGDTNIGATTAGADLSVFGQVNITEQTTIGMPTTPADLYVMGDVGIGITNPGAKLHVAGSAKINGKSYLEFGAGVVGKEPDAGKIGYGTLSFDPVTGDPLALDIVGAGITAAERRIKFWNEGGAVFVGPFQIGDSTSPADLDVSGNLQVEGSAEVGTTLAPTNLTVNGTLGVTGDVAIGEIGTPADLAVYGQAIIGEDANPTNLTLYGDLGVTGKNRAKLLLHQHNTGNDIAHQLRYSAGTLYLEAADNGSNTTTTPHFVVGGNLSTLGYLGIGTATPTEAIHLMDSRLLVERDATVDRGHALELRRLSNGDFDGTALTIDTGMGSGLVNIVGGAVIDPATGQRYTYLGNRGASRISLMDGGMEFNLGTRLGTAGEEVVWKLGLRIDPTGYVGIGTTTPESPLDVIGDVNITGNITLNDISTVDGRDISADGTSLDTLKTTINNGKDNWNTAYAERNQWNGGSTGLVKETGRNSLGLGDMALASKIDYYKNTDIDDFFEGEDASGKKQVHWENITNRPDDLANNWLVTGNNLHYVAGNVGIGTSTPVSPLDVTGDVHITGNISLEDYFKVDGRDISADGATLDSLKTTVTSGVSNWNTAYSERRQWDGGPTGLVKETGRNSLGLGDMALASKIDYYKKTEIDDELELKADLSGAIFTGSVQATSFSGNGAGLSGVAPTIHDHDDLYYNKTETDDFFEGQNTESGKKLVDWANILNRPDGLVNNWLVTENDLYYVAGNVGIGKADPGFPLDVEGDVNITGDISLGDTSTVDGRSISDDGADLDTLKSTVNDGKNNWNTAYTERGQWDGGDTGLDADAGRIALGLGDMALASTTDYYLKSDTDEFFEGVNAESGKKLVDWTNILNRPGDLANNWLVTENDDLYYIAGNVGIGTSTPAFPLDVTGDMNITGNITLDDSFTVDGRDISDDGADLDTLKSTVNDGKDNWNTAYTERGQWDGGDTGLDADAGRTALSLGDMALASTTDYYKKTDVYARSETYSKTETDDFFEGVNAESGKKLVDWENITNRPDDLVNNWLVTENDLHYDAGNVVIGTSSGLEPPVRLEVGGDMRIVENLFVGTYGKVISKDGEWLGSGVASDLTLKTNVENLKDSLNTVLSMQGIGFNWKDEKRGKGRKIGLIAQEVEKVLPQLVEEIGTGDKKHKTVDYTSFIPLLIEAIKEQQKEIERLRGEVMDHFAKFNPA